MASTYLEQTRATHEDLERLERIIVKDYKQEAKSHRERLMQNHRVRKRLDQMQEAARKLIKVYEDDDNSRKEEIAAMGSATTTEVFNTFYDRLKEVRDYHRAFPNTDITEAEDDSSLLVEEPVVEFSGEEAGGRYLDLHMQHQAFLNAKSFGRQLDYLQYLDSFADFSAVPRAAKVGKPYRDYLESLLNCFLSFYERTQPLAQTRKQLAKVHEELTAAWEEGTVPGWEDKGRGQAAGAGTAAAQQLALDLEAFECVEELESIGAERLKESLQALGLKCGGTARQRAERLYATKGKALSELDGRMFAKGAAPVAAAAARSEDDARRLEAACLRTVVLEAQVLRMSELLGNVVSDTKARVEKKQAQTYEELVAEAEAEAGEDVVDEDEDEEEYIYNPLKLPLGWDGRPIPYWLYKLHGLNQEFKCEICGNTSYWGRRAFERHFKEWRHSNGMRALGIPNTKEFYEVVKIEDALALWKALSSRTGGSFNAETDEELEDAQGNVYNKKTYEDLRRQGLI